MESSNILGLKWRLSDSTLIVNINTRKCTQTYTISLEVPNDITIKICDSTESYVIGPDSNYWLIEIMRMMLGNSLTPPNNIVVSGPTDSNRAIVLYSGDKPIGVTITDRLVPQFVAHITETPRQIMTRLAHIIGTQCAHAHTLGT